MLQLQRAHVRGGQRSWFLIIFVPGCQARQEVPFLLSHVFSPQIPHIYQFLLVCSFREPHLITPPPFAPSSVPSTYLCTLLFSASMTWIFKIPHVNENKYYF